MRLIIKHNLTEFPAIRVLSVHHPQHHNTTGHTTNTTPQPTPPLILPHAHHNTTITPHSDQNTTLSRFTVEHHIATTLTTFRHCNHHITTITTTIPVPHHATTAPIGIHNTISTASQYQCTTFHTTPHHTTIKKKCATTPHPYHNTHIQNRKQDLRRAV
ncbi:hypothetical protein E2C01_028619 [Portunus trituberculatus]|uniref:Uncharacterized protein n=1 Tax=Portunus trituberculatus TaxID=210409 RepID=A0A5B7EL51_PORTR|nr:hypothetical protein [Portunus trituberculatus]